MDVYNIKQTISTYFRDKHLLHYKLQQVYILYMALQNIEKEPTLVKGYLINHFIQNYYITFWVVCDGELHNIIDETLTYSLDLNVELMETLPIHIKLSYLNMDNEIDTALTNANFYKCLDGSEQVDFRIQPLFKRLNVKLQTNYNV